MLISPFGPFGAVMPARNLILARYWRIRATSGWSDYWDLLDDGSAGVFMAGDLSGTDLAGALTRASTIDILASNDANYDSVNSTGNGFSGATRLCTDDATGSSDVKLWMDFTTANSIGSIRYTSRSTAALKPAAMALEYSSNNSSWSSYATLTDAKGALISIWRNIIVGSTIAAATS